jgi:CheY-like chemotaxis protein
VLVVDDTLRYEARFIRNSTAIVSFAQMPKTAEQVLEILPDLIILDLSMPVMKGLDAAPELKILPDCPIIFADTLVQSSDVEARGITCVVAKDDVDRPSK